MLESDEVLDALRCAGQRVPPLTRRIQSDVLFVVVTGDDDDDDGRYCG